MINKILIFAAGVVIGSAVTWKCIKDKYKKLADEEIASVKEVWRKKQLTVEDVAEACVNEGVNVDITLQPKPSNTGFKDYRSMKNIITENNYADEKEEDYMDKYVISPDEYGESELPSESLTYWADGVVKAYDVSDMRNAVYSFAAQSTNQADYCLRLVSKMKFKSEEPAVALTNDEKPLVFYDCEVFPNLFLVNWKVQGEGKPIVRLINPRPQDIEELIKFRLVGFNCRRYDNHMLYACMMGYTNEQLYDLSQKIINTKKGDSRKVLFGEAYNISYTDIYDFASAGNKKSLKKLEIEMGIHHQELGLPWDKPVPKELWQKVAEYCDNDVLATEAAWDYLKSDFIAREILADLAGLTVNDTTNTLTTTFIFGNRLNPQNEFNYRNLAEPVFEMDEETRNFLEEACPEMMSQTHGEAGSLLPYFPGYKYENGVSTYCGEEVGEGGYVYAEPGMYGNVALLDIASMHPHSTIAECLFGVRYTKAYRDIVEGRVSIKHEAWDEVDKMLDGKLKPYIQRVKDGELTSKDLANALKTAINSVYGLTSAT